MTTILDYRRNFPVTKQYRRQRDGISAQLGVLSMWAVAGLALTGLAFELGFGTDVMQALAASG